MKRNYIEPELQVFACKPRAILMASVLDPSIVDTDQLIIPTEEEWTGEFGGRDFELEEFEDEEDFF